MADPARLNGADGSIVLVRHGESTWIGEGRFQGRQDPPLSDLGRLQAERVAGRLGSPAAAPSLPLPDDPPFEVRSSPLARAAAVATAIGDAHGIATVPDPDLTEIAQGAWEGLTTAEVTARYGQELAAWRSRPVGNHAPGGEPLTDAAVRAARVADGAIGSLRAERSRIGAAGEPAHPRGHVLGYGRPGDDGDSWPWLVLVGHDGLLKLVLLHLLDLPIERFWSFPFALCGVTIVEVRAGVIRLRAHNMADHLHGLDGNAPARHGAA